MTDIDPSEYARTLIHNYGWSVARSMAAREAALYSPTGNLDGFWTQVLAAIENQTGEKGTVAR